MTSDPIKDRNDAAERVAKERLAEVAQAIRDNAPELLQTLGDRGQEAPEDLFTYLACGWRFPADVSSVSLICFPSREVSDLLHAAWDEERQGGPAAWLDMDPTPGGTVLTRGPWADAKLIELAAVIPAGDGLGLLALAVETYIAAPINTRHLLTTVERSQRPDRLILTRQPTLATYTLNAWIVDGEAVATATHGQFKRRYRPAPRPPQAELWATPRTLDGRDTGSAVIEAVSGLALDGDERSPLRADLLRAADTATALSGTATMSIGEAAEWVGGADTPANRLRAERVIRIGRSLEFRPDPRLFPYSLMDAEFGGDVVRIGPPRWWLDKKGPRAHRLTGGLLRKATKWGAVERTIAGIESALGYGQAAGKGRHGRIPDNLRADPPGGPGPKVFIPWWLALRLSGEHVGPDASGSAVKMRWKRRHEALKAAGYFVGPRGRPAPARDTVEIVRRQHGTRNRPAGLWIRATARYCTALAAPVIQRIPADRLLRRAPSDAE